ncbi:Uncharacterised protein [Enterobacter cloacae]|uniref:Uncharacterized protein n=1 Tax=Enterobacter cloacae TaxID=550 RepID=A0A377LZF1_ENTCL|nr:Uncharacterised protein [Enterobacter cloacae]
MKKVLLTHTSLNSFIIQPESYGATVDEGFIVGGPVGDFELLLCHGTVCVVGKIRDLILQLSKSSIYSTKPRVIKEIDILLAQNNRRDVFILPFPCV